MRTLTKIFLASSFCFTLVGCGMEGDESSVIELRAKAKVACGGFAGLTCPNDNQTCVDDPSDSCDPDLGGADCMGMCVNGNGGGNGGGNGNGGCNNGDQNYTYVADSPEECAVINFMCAEGSSHFSDDCGCGCVLDDPLACDFEADPSLTYVGQSPEECTYIKFACDVGSHYFADDCGCGCETDEVVCDYNDPNRGYVAESLEECALINFMCAEGTHHFGDECGCGCEID